MTYELARSENAVDTVRLIRRVCDTYGIFDRLYTDNSKPFAGHLVAGGAVHRFRNAGRKMEGVKPLGICHHPGIKLHFAIPRNAQAKIAERIFATLSRTLDDRPEFQGAHAGHAPGAAPDEKVKPVPFKDAAKIIAREVARHNAKVGRRGQGMAGRSYQEAFEAGLKLRIPRKATARQLYLAGLIYTPASVDRWGRVTVAGWTYGGPDTQEDLLPYHHAKEQVLVGRNPDDLAAPVLAWNAEIHLICEGIEPVIAGDYGSVDGAREAARSRKAARDAVRKAEEALNLLPDARYAEILAAIPTPPAPAPVTPAVVGGHFGGSLDRTAKPPRAGRARRWRYRESSCGISRKRWGCNPAVKAAGKALPRPTRHSPAG
jgi:putative transposase